MATRWPAWAGRYRWRFVAAALLLGITVLAAASGAGVRAAWWLLSADPPAVEASLPAGPIRGELPVPVAIRPADRAILRAALVDGRRLAAAPPVASPWRWILTGGGVPSAEASAPASQLALNTTTLSDGRHTLRLEVEDSSRRHNRSALELSFISDNTPPSLSVEPDSPRLQAGRVGMLRIQADEPADLRGSWAGEPLTLLPQPGERRSPASAGAGSSGPVFVSLVAVAVTAPDGEIALKLTGRDAAGNTSELTAVTPVEAQNLPRQVLLVPPELAALATGPIATTESAQLERLTRSGRPERAWQGAFRLPLVGIAVRTTGFGDRRDYADGYVAYHGGYDLAAPLGAPVLASAAGSVVFAGPLAQRGNTVVLDHGWGIATVYAHLSQIQVQVDQVIAQGQLLGAIGSTGLSTGPHLHWEVRLRGLPVDPGAWLATSAQL